MLGVGFFQSDLSIGMLVPLIRTSHTSEIGDLYLWCILLALQHATLYHILSASDFLFFLGICMFF